MPFLPVMRGTLLIPSGTYHDPDRKHLFVICTDPCEKGLQIIVSISTWTNNLCDGTCVLDPHVHRFIRHKSYVMYRSARIEKAETLIKGVEQDLFVPHVAFEVHIFERIASGICSSLHTKRQVKRYYGCS